jgi:hypothetical protein
MADLTKLPDAEALSEARLNIDTLGEDCPVDDLVNSGIDLLALVEW